MALFQFDAIHITSVQNRASDLWECSTKIEDHMEYIAVANRLLGALEMLWSSATIIDEEGDNKT